MESHIYDVLSQKYQEAISQGIGDAEIVEYLCDNTNENVDDIITFVSQNL
jgi:hypothetical protein